MLWWATLGLISFWYNLKTSESIYWPAGSYGLPKPTSGCRWADGFQWETGWRSQDTNDKYSNNAKSAEFHLDGVVDHKKVNRSFCIKTFTANDKNKTAWPSGKYCIYRKNGQCPAGLWPGYVIWDDDDGPQNNNKKDGILPDGVYNHNTEIQFCCRTDGDKNDPISLPSQTPFFLLAYESAKCQMVKWAVASQEWIYYDTEDDQTGDKAVGEYPYQAEIKHPTIYYCYYKECNETLTAVNGTFHSPNYPRKYPDGQYCSWRITVNQQQRIHLTFTNFSLQSENNTDSLYVYDGETVTGEVLGMFYGGHHPPKEGINSSSNHLFIIFKSDKNGSYPGFNASYSAVNNPAPTAVTTTATTTQTSEVTLSSIVTTNLHPTPTDGLSQTKAPTAVTTTKQTSEVTLSSIVSTNLHPTPTDGLSQTKDSPTEPGKLSKDIIYLPVIGVLFVILTVFVIYTAWKFRKRRRENRLAGISVGEIGAHATNECEIGFDNELMNNTGNQIPGQYMDLSEVTQSPERLHGTGDTETSPYLEINDYASLHPGTRSWEVRRENVIIEKIIGNGAFGQVAQGKSSQLRGIEETTRVAIKMLKDNAPETDRKDLLSELEVMKKLKPHPHVIKLLGCVTESEPLLVIIEYVPCGDLLGYLRKSRGLNDMYYKDPDVKPQTSLTSQQLLKFSWQVADGMQYLSSRKIIHRDLAARNVLVGEQERCKVTDFGMARDIHQENIYEMKTRGRLPVKWTAYEGLLYGRYTTKSDVWSYGVVLYEIFTVGGSPYPRTKGRQMADFLRRGYRMPKPKHVDDALYKIMLNCWKEDPDDRSTFENLTIELKEMEKQHKRLFKLQEYDKALYENVEDLMF